ncbi:uncharacterized protein BDR25DRAFT_348570 [Lindgomyces ingoldianus]|uniref:Uncharacterized protein n=1 Tax=Lindgomyces ingoldianus TaxID=673940 RepID=A0ACB6RIL5_9PLEO|nr:uncharacterized protein BDR25DRAFT_348570 [Lindgomyces ingoldianus]KAF2478311.1 hypothetical protein BDR25DRAFT_348570 [Lindgomyces ingoldianus]
MTVVSPDTKPFGPKISKEEDLIASRVRRGFGPDPTRLDAQEAVSQWHHHTAESKGLPSTSFMRRLGLHGWPEPFYKVRNVMEPLLEPGNATDAVFEPIVWSLLGFWWPQGPNKGLNTSIVPDTSRVWHKPVTEVIGLCEYVPGRRATSFPKENKSLWAALSGRWEAAYGRAYGNFVGIIIFVVERYNELFNNELFITLSLYFFILLSIMTKKDLMEVLSDCIFPFDTFPVYNKAAATTRSL